ncbi:hypothetical protein DFH09DRAFT_1170229, partial [Mycena vulgaris]
GCSPSHLTASHPIWPSPLAPPRHHLLRASHPLYLPIVVSHPHRRHTSLPHPPLSSVWPRRFLRPYLPSSPPLAAHSPLHPVFISISILVYYPPVLSSTHPSIAPPSAPHSHTHPHPHPISSMPCRSPLRSRTRAHPPPSYISFSRFFTSHPSTLYGHSLSFSSLPYRSRGLPLAHPPASIHF